MRRTRTRTPMILITARFNRTLMYLFHYLLLNVKTKSYKIFVGDVDISM